MTVRCTGNRVLSSGLLQGPSARGVVSDKGVSTRLDQVFSNQSNGLPICRDPIGIDVRENCNVFSGGMEHSDSIGFSISYRLIPNFIKNVYSDKNQQIKNDKDC